MKQAEVCARYHINAGRSATSIVATDSVFLFKGQSENGCPFLFRNLRKDLFGDIPPLSMIEGAFLKYFGIPVALTWFMSQKTFDGKKPYSFLKSQITYALRPKITYAGKAVKLHKQILNETITAVRSVNYVPDKIY